MKCFTKLDHRQGPWYTSGLFEANKSYKAYNSINKFVLATWRLQIKLYFKMNSSYIKISAPGRIPTPPGGLSSSSSTSNKFQKTKFLSTHQKQRWSMKCSKRGWLVCKLTLQVIWYFYKKTFNIKNGGFVANESSYEHKTKIHPSGEQKKAFFDF